ncbi:hypothetical protein Tco_0362716, partial [Tanacetum coccineum]
VEEQSVLETFSNITPKNKAHYDAEKEAIHLIMTGIGNDIYSTVDACKTTHDMWIAIARLQQGESLNKQDVKTSLFLEFGRFTSRDGESIESYYSRFYKMMNEMTQDLDKVSYHKLFDILKHCKKEVNEIRAKKIAKNANPLSLVVAAQQYPNTYNQAPKPQRSYALPAKTSPSTRSHATTRHKGKEISKPTTPPSESASEEDSDLQTINNNLRTSLNSRNKNVDTTPRYVNKNQTGQKPKRAKDYTYHKEKILLCKQADKGVSLQAEQADWLEDTDEEIDEQELEAHYNFMAEIQEVLHAESGYDVEPLEKIQYDAEYNVFVNERQHSEQPESINDTHVVEKDDSNVILDSSNMCDNDNQANQNVEECDDEHVVLANLKKANTSLSHELQECKSALEECKSSLEKSNRTRDRYLGALHDKEVELEK